MNVLVFFFALPPIAAPAAPKSNPPATAPPGFETYCVEVWVFVSVLTATSVILLISRLNAVPAPKNLKPFSFKLTVHIVPSASGKPYICLRFSSTGLKSSFAGRGFIVLIFDR